MTTEETKYDSNDDETIFNPGLIEDEYDEEGHHRVFSGFKLELKPKIGNQIGWDKDIKTKIPNESKVLLFIGETGAGKSSTLNTIQNHLEKVKYKDDFRWKLVDERIKSKKSSESQTGNLTIYNANEYVFVDTPGFNDTGGKAKDDKTINDIKLFLDSALDYIDGICFIVKNSDNRKTKSMLNVIDCVFGLFANDVINNIFIIITHSDNFKAKLPNVIAEHSILKNHVNQLKGNVFCINNTPFMDTKSENDSDSDSDSDLDSPSPQEIFFNKTNKKLKKFFDKINQAKRVSINKTSETLRLKHKIKTHIRFLNADIKLLLRKRVLFYKLKNEGSILINDEIVTQMTVKKQIVTKNRCFNNNVLETTCHIDCKAWGKGLCCMVEHSISDSMAAKCTKCGYKAKEHVFEKKYWITRIDPKVSKLLAKNMKQTTSLETKLIEFETNIYGKIGCIVIFGNELNAIALKPIEYTVKSCIDSLISEFGNKVLDDELQCLKDLYNESIMDELNKEFQNIINKGIKFTDLKHHELITYYQKIRSIVTKYIKKQRNVSNNCKHKPSITPIIRSDTVVVNKNVNSDLSHGKVIEYESSTSDYFVDGNALHTKSVVVPSDVDEI